MKMRIPSNLFSEIVGYEDVKSLLLKAIKSYGDGLPVHFLLVGEPNTVLVGGLCSAKTMFLLALKRIRGSIYLLGSRSSRAGLTSLLIEKKPPVLLIDELDKMHPENMTVLLSLMETGLVVEALHRRFRTEKLETIVVATCNDLYNIPKELQSRFLIVRFKPYSFREFCKVVTQILVKREKVKRKIARHIAFMVWNKLKSKDIRDAIKVGRLVHKKQSIKNVNKIICTLQKYS
jgi:Holliday junction DNA helicase RuvB